MATITGNNGVIKFDATVGGSPTAVANVRNFSIDLKRDTIEYTVMTNDQRFYTTGLSSWSGSADIYFDPTASTGTLGAISILNPTQGSVGQGTTTFQGFLDSSSYKFEGECIITGFTIKSSVDGMVEASISFQGSGACAFSAT
jgi:predicted secreted protein